MRTKRFFAHQKHKNPLFVLENLPDTDMTDETVLEMRRLHGISLLPRQPQSGERRQEITGGKKGY
ncbi:hypothetical protein PMAC_002944 [Pneumocystis sp. 'macacae']|nr:hypothetical protein PMAC_002944 [Pneumocystis sp. 'macacae']